MYSYSDPPPVILFYPIFPFQLLSFDSIIHLVLIDVLLFYQMMNMDLQNQGIDGLIIIMIIIVYFRNKC